MTITISTLAPFSSFVVAQSITKKVDFEFLIFEVHRIIEPLDGWAEVDVISDAKIKGFDHVVSIRFVEEREPSWGSGSDCKDTLNHLLVILVKGRFAAIYVSDSEAKTHLQDALSSDEIAYWEPVEESTLISAYVNGNDLKSLWLGGTHRSVSFKPNSKIISGSNLADAIDPFGDSTFVAGAVRSSKAGVSLRRSGVWFGPNKTWDAFCDSALNLLTALLAVPALKTGAQPIVHPGLATTLFDFKNVNSAYDIAWAEPETLNGDRRKNKITTLINDFSMELKSAAGSGVDINVIVTHKESGKENLVTICPKFNSRRLSFEIVGSVCDELTEWEEAIKGDPELIKIYYDTGHTIASGSLNFASVQDRPFKFKFCTFGPEYNITKEKPDGNPPPIEDIFDDGVTDQSLFKWIVKDGLNQLALAAPKKGECWLYCDDRSGEVADFIHVYKPLSDDPKITLIHAKGANSAKKTRRISPCAYELVTAQAMKNLRRMIASNLLSEIKKCVTDHGDNRVWDKPWRKNLKSDAKAKFDLLDAINGISANCEYEVIIVQPHVLQSKYFNAIKQECQTTGAKQLRSLLFGAKAMAHSASATFCVVADDR
jgi:hypothetical protein